MAEKQDEERFEEEAGLFLKELRLAGCQIFGPYHRSPNMGSYAVVVHGNLRTVIRYKDYQWFLGGFNQPPMEGFEHAKDELMRLLRIRDE